MIGKTARFLIIFTIFLFSSPWFLILIQNHRLILKERKETIFSRNQVFIDEINTLRGETIKFHRGMLGKLIINKLTIYGQEMLTRYLESFDPNYLFFTGGIDRITSTGSSGQIPLSFLPLIIYGVVLITSSDLKKKYVLLGLIFVSPIFSALFYKHYEWAPKILFFLSLVVLSGYSFLKIPKTKKVLIAVFFAFWIFETLNFYHKFKNHYTQNLARQIYNIKSRQ